MLRLKVGLTVSLLLVDFLSIIGKAGRGGGTGAGDYVVKAGIGRSRVVILSLQNSHPVTN